MGRVELPVAYSTVDGLQRAWAWRATQNCAKLQKVWWYL